MKIISLKLVENMNLNEIKQKCKLTCKSMEKMKSDEYLSPMTYIYYIFGNYVISFDWLPVLRSLLLLPAAKLEQHGFCQWGVPPNSPSVGANPGDCVWENGSLLSVRRRCKHLMGVACP